MFPHMPKKKRSLIIPILLLALPVPAWAQPLLTLQEAIGLAMTGNHTVLLSEEDAAVARNNNTLGNAGFLPTVDVTAGVNGALNNARQRYATGEVIDRSAAGSSTLTSGIGLGWTVFDGFRMFNRRGELRELEALGDATVQVARESIAAQVARAYYDVVQQQQVLDVLRETVALSEERVENARLKNEVGESSGLEVLQARVDLNADRSAVLRQEVSLATARTTLNQLLGRTPETPFAVVDTIIIAGDLDYDVFRSRALAENSDLRAAQISRRVAEYTLEEVKSGWYPRVGVNLGYNLTQSETEAGLVASNRNSGLSYGVSASMNLFNGFNTDRETENARIRIAASDIRIAELRSRVESDLLRAWTNYENRMALVALEQENLGIAGQNLDIALERFRVGAIIPLELREAQTARVEAESRLVTARYEAKLAEIELLRLSGGEMR